MEARDMIRQWILDIRRYWPLLVFGIIMGIFLMIIMRPKESTNKIRKSKSETIQWTCAMHPHIQLPESGVCPICAMDLIPLQEQNDHDSDDAVSITLDPRSKLLAAVETAEVIYDSVVHDVRLIGKVEYDETRLSYISARVPGRIERMFVDYTGIKVRKGDHLIELYSPELISAQEEYLQALDNAKTSQSSSLTMMRSTAATTVKSAQEKLRLLGITEDQIDRIKKKNRPKELLTIYSKDSGTVIQKNGFEGMYVETGDQIYTIADLSQVWLYLDAYEQDIQWFHYGQKVFVEAESYPGETFYGKVSFIAPVVDQTTRTIKLRVNVENTANKLKPGMFVRARIQVVLGEQGAIYQEDLAGKWICPMHPEVVKPQASICSICEMDLIPTQEFGFSNQPSLIKQALVIPKTAPLITGKRAVVYVEHPTDITGVHRYQVREVVLGPRAGDRYIVLSGLEVGERVVTKGNFKIDSALQIQAKPSMMNRIDSAQSDDESFYESGNNLKITNELNGLLEYYFHFVQALAADDFSKAQNDLFKLKTVMQSLLDKKSDVYAAVNADIKAMLADVSMIISDDESLRQALMTISIKLKNIFDMYDYQGDVSVYLMFCPMAMQGGAYWFQNVTEVSNPYFGPAMLGCGDLKKAIGHSKEEQNNNDYWDHHPAHHHGE